MLYSNLLDPFSLSCLILLWFPHSNLKLLYSIHSGVTCRHTPDAKQRALQNAGGDEDFREKEMTLTAPAATRCGGSGGKRYMFAWTVFVEAEGEKYQSTEGWSYSDGPQQRWSKRCPMTK